MSVAAVREAGERLLGYLPSFYESVREFQILADTEGDELDDVKQQLEELLDQAFVGTATWGLARWEAEFGIVPPAGQPIEQRRAVVQSRIRGTGTVTVALVKSVAEAYDRGTIEVTEQPAKYQVTVRFVDTLGAPPNLNDLKAAIDEIKPGHIAVVYQYKYITLSQLDKTMTINQIQQRRLTDFSPFIPH